MSAIGSRWIAALLLATGLTGCITAAEQATPIRPITCTAGADCDAKWSRAASWIALNPAWKTKTRTDQFIETTGHDTLPAFAITNCNHARKLRDHLRGRLRQSLWLHPDGGTIAGAIRKFHARAIKLAACPPYSADSAYSLTPVPCAVCRSDRAIDLHCPPDAAGGFGGSSLASVSIDDLLCGRETTKCSRRTATLRQPRRCLDFNPPLRFLLRDEAGNMITPAVGPRHSDVPSRS
jgi:hypothetical protein